MPVKIRRRGSRYRVTDAGKVTARSSTRRNAKRQANLLRGVAHGWKPTHRRQR
jgi:hypothetical protein